jgi:hypothetical protein
VNRCQNCHRPATLRIETDDGHMFLCIDCNLKLEQASALEYQRTIQQFNIAAAAVETTTGLRGLLPRMSNLPVHSFSVEGATVNNIKVDHSVIGVLNTGSIKNVDNAVTVLRQSGDEQIALAITDLTKAVIDARNVDTEAKNKIVELLSVIAEEAARPIPERRSAVARSLLSELCTLIGGAAGLSHLWDRYGPTLQSAFY